LSESSAPTIDTTAADFLVAAAERVTTGYPDLFRHQATGVAFLLSRRRAILADDMGLECSTWLGRAGGFAQG
jgi:hypothetical protein